MRVQKYAFFYSQQIFRGFFHRKLKKRPEYALRGPVRTVGGFDLSVGGFEISVGGFEKPIPPIEKSVGGIG